MNAQEMSNVFDVKLNSYLNQRGYGIQQGDTDFTCNEYEKSLFLTQVQLEVVEAYYSVFEQSEQAREILSNLVTTSTYALKDITTDANTPIFYNSKNFKFSTINDSKYKKEDIFRITLEGVKYEDTDSCIKDNLVKVIPVTQDQLNKIIMNPFRGPNNTRVLRLDAGTNLEFISVKPLSTYFCRYIKRPSPIITVDLPGSVTIEGENISSDCELSTSIHETLVDMAVQAAIKFKSIGRLSTTQSN